MSNNQAEIKNAIANIMTAQKKISDKHKTVNQITSLLIERRDAQVSAIEAQQEDQEGQDQESPTEEDYPLPGLSEDEESLQGEEKQMGEDVVKPAVSVANESEKEEVKEEEGCEGKREGEEGGEEDGEEDGNRGRATSRDTITPLRDRTDSAEPVEPDTPPSPTRKTRGEHRRLSRQHTSTHVRSHENRPSFVVRSASNSNLHRQPSNLRSLLSKQSSLRAGMGSIGSDDGHASDRFLRRMSTRKALVFVPDKPEAVECGTQTSEMGSSGSDVAGVMNRFQEHLEAKLVNAEENGVIDVMEGIALLRSASIGSPAIKAFLDELTDKLKLADEVMDERRKSVAAKEAKKARLLSGMASMPLEEGDVDGSKPRSTSNASSGSAVEGWRGATPPTSGPSGQDGSSRGRGGRPATDGASDSASNPNTSPIRSVRKQNKPNTLDGPLGGSLDAYSFTSDFTAVERSATPHEPLPPPLSPTAQAKTTGHSAGGADGNMYVTSTQMLDNMLRSFGASDLTSTPYILGLCDDIERLLDAQEETHRACLRARRQLERPTSDGTLQGIDGTTPNPSKRAFFRGAGELIARSEQINAAFNELHGVMASIKCDSKTGRVDLALGSMERVKALMRRRGDAGSNLKKVLRQRDEMKGNPTCSNQTDADSDREKLTLAIEQSHADAARIQEHVAAIHERDSQIRHIQTEYANLYQMVTELEQELLKTQESERLAVSAMAAQRDDFDLESVSQGASSAIGIATAPTLGPSPDP